MSLCATETVWRRLPTERPWEYSCTNKERTKLFKFSNEEFADVHLVYGFWDENSLSILKVYKHQFLDQRQPYRLVTEMVNMREIAFLMPYMLVGRARRKMRDEKNVLDIVQDNPPIITRQMSTTTGLSHSTLRCTLAWNSVASFPFTAGNIVAARR
jgi:hypothetical protein